MKKLVMVEVLSQFRNRYVVEVKDDIDHALDEYTMREHDIEFKEFSQEHLGEQIVSHRVVTKEEALALCDKDNDYTVDWTENQKLKNFFTSWKEQNDK